VTIPVSGLWPGSPDHSLHRSLMTGELEDQTALLSYGYTAGETMCKAWWASTGSGTVSPPSFNG